MFYRTLEIISMIFFSSKKKILFYICLYVFAEIFSLANFYFGADKTCRPLHLFSKIFNLYNPFFCNQFYIFHSPNLYNFTTAECS